MSSAFHHKRVLILGLGETGLSALRWLSAQGATLSVADTRPQPPGLEQLKDTWPNVKVYTGPFQAEPFEWAEMIVISPGISIDEPMVQQAIARGVDVAGDVELFARFKPETAKVIAITGSNGKSTVTTLVGEMCKAAGLSTVVAGNIGLPVLDTLAMPTPDVYVLELSSFQLESTYSLTPQAATMLNLSEDHLDRHQGMDAYARAKSRIFNGSGLQVLNRDDAYSMAMRKPGHPVVTFGMDASHEAQAYGLETINGEVWLKHGRRRMLALSACQLTGLHNAANLLAAIALCHGIGLENHPLLEAARTFKGLPHRVEWVRTIGGVDFYDDSKGTNVGATCAAIAGLQRRVILIAGGEGKGQDFTPLKQPVHQHARAVVLIGRDAPLIEQALLSTEVPLYHAIDMREAVAISLRVAQQGDAVLLSPACASFDMFKNYVHRAEVFIACVQRLAEEVNA